jgi:hypothetical protein
MTEALYVILGALIAHLWGLVRRRLRARVVRRLHGTLRCPYCGLYDALRPHRRAEMLADTYVCGDERCGCVFEWRSRLDWKILE